MINFKSEQQKGVISLIFLALIFASMGLFARYLSTSLLLFQQVYLRVGAAFLLGLFFFRDNLNFRKLTKITKKEWLLLIFRSITSYLLGVTLYTQSIVLTKFSNVSFIGALPIVAILGVMFLKEKLTFKKFLLVLAAFLGVVLIVVKDYSHLFVWGQGEILAILSTLAFSISYIARRWHDDLLNNQEITQITFFVSFILILATSIIAGEGMPDTNWNRSLVLAILGAGLFNVINLFLTNYGFQKVDAIIANNILTLQSVFAIILGFLFYREVPIFTELIGGIIIVLSVIIMNKLESKEKSPN